MAHFSIVVQFSTSQSTEKISYWIYFLNKISTSSVSTAAFTHRCCCVFLMVRFGSLVRPTFSLHTVILLCLSFAFIRKYLTWQLCSFPDLFLLFATGLALRLLTFFISIKEAIRLSCTDLFGILYQRSLKTFAFYGLIVAQENICILYLHIIV